MIILASSPAKCNSAITLHGCSFSLVLTQPFAVPYLVAAEWVFFSFTRKTFSSSYAYLLQARKYFFLRRIDRSYWDKIFFIRGEEGQAEGDVSRKPRGSLRDTFSRAAFARINIPTGFMLLVYFFLSGDRCNLSSFFLMQLSEVKA